MKRIMWPREDVQLMLDVYPTEGAVGVYKRLRHRSLKSIQAKAIALGLSDIRDDSRCVDDFVSLPTTTLTEQLECVRLRKWKGPVRKEPFTPNFGLGVAA